MQSYLKNFSDKFVQMQFDLRVNVAHGDLFEFDKFEVVKQINSTRNFFSREPVVFIADPFLFVHQDELYLFYEKQTEIHGLGIIKMRKTRDLKAWTPPKIVLKEKFHLSYPYVFSFDGQIYMMPETHQDKSLKLYIPNNDLTKWKPHKTLLSGEDYVDSAIIFHQGRYYLFTTIYNDEKSVLLLFHAENINGEWTEHPQSPLKSDINDCRCAGSPFHHNGKLYRPCQRYDNKYGDGVDIYQIIQLSSEEYLEEKILNVIPNSENFYSIGGHHFNPCRFKGKQLVATDALTLRVNFHEVMRRIRNKFVKR